MARIKVDLKERGYDVLVGADVLEDVGRIIEAEEMGSDVFIITDPVVNDLYGDAVRKGLKNLKQHIGLLKTQRNLKKPSYFH